MGLHQVVMECLRELPFSYPATWCDRIASCRCIPFSIWVCKSLIDVATRHSDGNMRTLVMLIVGCLAVRLLLSVTGGWLGSLTEVRLRNALRYRLLNG